MKFQNYFFDIYYQVVNLPAKSRKAKPLIKHVLFIYLFVCLFIHINLRQPNEILK